MNIEQTPRVILNSIKTPDGTVLTSQHRHDYVSHKDENGELYFTDGGHDYIRRSVNKEPYISNDLYDTDDIEIIRKKFKRGGRGKHGDEPLTFVALKDMNDNWLHATIKYINNALLITNHQISDPTSKNYSPVVALYSRELDYRKKHNIYVAETK